MRVLTDKQLQNMTSKKKQHYIPRSYLRAWCDPAVPDRHEPYVWLMSRARPEARRKSPKTIFFESDLYTVDADDTDRNLAIEDALMRAEDRFVRVRKSVLSDQKPISEESKEILTTFVAAMHARTIARREWNRSQWNRVRDMADKMLRVIDEASPEQLETMRRISEVSQLSRQTPSLGYEDVVRITEYPLQDLIASEIAAETCGLMLLDLAILRTQDIPGFVTSDDPCVWFDQQSSKRPPHMRSPALMYKSIEVTLPAAPDCMLFFNRQGITGYLDIDARVVDKLNVRTITFSQEVFVTSRGHIRLAWYPQSFRKRPWLWRYFTG